MRVGRRGGVGRKGGGGEEWGVEGRMRVGRRGGVGMAEDRIGEEIQYKINVRECA